MQRVYNPDWVDDEAREALNNYMRLLPNIDDIDWNYVPSLFQFCGNPTFEDYDLQELKNKLERK